MANVIREDVVQLNFEVEGFKEIKKIQDELNDLKKKLSGGVGEEAFDDLKDSVEKTEKPLKNVKEQAEKVRKKVEEIGKKAATTAFNGLKKLAGISFKALTVGIGAAATAVGGLAVKAVSAYADFEQLKGGVETLFGAKGAQSVEEYAKLTGKSVETVKKEYEGLKEVESLVIENANNAFKTAGLSANDYMQNVTSFSAALISSCGGNTKEAAELANQAMIDMSDNANKMGSDMESIIGTYQSISRGNYAMLDNLKLGYGGTKKEMERLVNDAAKIDKAIKKNDLSYANVVKAIHAVQEQMSITGTTQKEAEKTISGSLNMVKAAWGNLMPAIVQGGDVFDQCIENLIYSVDKFTDNLMPALEKALGGVGKLIEKLAPKFAEKFPVLAKKLIPPLIKAAVEITKGLIDAMPTIIKTVFDTIVDICGEQFPVLKKLSGVFSQNAEAIGKLTPAIIGLVAAFKGLSKVKSIVSGFKGITGIFGGGKGGDGGGLGGLGGGKDGKSGGMLGSFSNMKVGDMGKNIAKIAMVVGALAGLTYLLGKLSNQMRSENMDATEMLKLVGVMGAVGTVGGVIAKVAAVLGAGSVATIKAVAIGMAAIAVVIGSIELIFVALGALSSIPGFDDLVEKGGELLAKTFKAIGKAIGSLIAGFGEGITSTLPAIGENLAGFTKSLEGGNWEIMKTFFNSLSGIKDVPNAGGIFGYFTGDPYNGLMKMTAVLPFLANSVSSFMSKMGSTTDFTALSSLMQAIASVKDVPATGGLAQLFMGDAYNGLLKMALILPSLADGISSFMSKMGGVTDYTALSSLLTAISAVAGVPSAGGIVGLFTGDAYNGLLKMCVVLPRLGTAAGAFMTNIGGLTNFSPIASLLNALSNVSAIPSSGGFFQLFTGDPYTGLLKLIVELPALGVSAAAFMNTIGGITDFTPISSLLNALSNVGALPSSGGFFQLFTGDPYAGLLKLILELPPLAVSVRAFYDALGDRTDFTAISALLNALATVDELPNAGGFAQFFTGDPYTALAALVVELPLIGASVGKFYEGIGERTDFTVISSLFNALSSVDDLPSAGGFAQFFTGSAYTALGAMILELPLLGESVKSFYNSLEGIDDFTKMTSLFTTLGGLDDAIGKDGGLFDVIGKIFNGSEESAIFKLGVSLKSFATNASGFFTMLKTADTTKISPLFTSLKSASGVEDAPNLADLGSTLSTFNTNTKSFFTSVTNLNTVKLGNVWTALKNAKNVTNPTNLSGVGTTLKTFGTNVKSFFNQVNKLNTEKLNSLWTCLSQIQNISDSTTIDSLGLSLKDFGTNTKSFFTNVNKLNIMKLNGLWESLKKPATITTDLQDIVDENISDIVDKISKLPSKMGKALKDNGSSLSSALVKIWKDAVIKTKTPINKLISGANWLLKKFGSDKTIEKWEPYAKGTDGHKGGNALVNDGRGAELVQMPNGSSFIPKGRNVFMPNAPVGMKVLPAEQTAQLMGKSSPTFKYDKGTGDIDIWSYFDNASGLVKAVKDKFVSYKGLSGMVLNISKGMVDTVSKPMTGWVDKLFEEFGALSLAAYNSAKGVEQWRTTVIQALKMEGLYSEANVNRTLYQMQTESGGNPYAINLWDINAKRGIPSKGLMQVIDPTFKAYARAGFNTNIYDPLSNILASIRYAVSRYGSLEKAYRGVGYANGGIATTPSIFGEDGAEMAIPLSKNKRARALNLYAQTGKMLGLATHSPDGDASSRTQVNSVENNTYSPVFNLTISGTTDDRATARKVKRWVKEAMSEMIESAGRKTPVLQEI